jgi:hypothetical protein
MAEHTRKGHRGFGHDESRTLAIAASILGLGMR